MRRTGATALAAGLVLAAALGGVLLVQSRLDEPALRQAVIASVERQSGRTMQLGQLELHLLPTPRIEADQVALADRPGAANPWMARIEYLRATIGVWPLFWHVVRLDDLALDGVTLHLARDADGHGNWEMAPRRNPDPGSGRSHGAHARWEVQCGAVRIRNARVSFRDARMHRGADLQLTEAAARGLRGDRPHFSLTGVRGDAAYTVRGTVGSIRRLLDGDDRHTAWPVSLRASETIDGSEVARGRAEGGMTDPLHGRGYALALTASLSQLADLDQLFVHAGLPHIQGLTVSARVIDRGRPVLEALRAQAGATAWPGLRYGVLRGWSVAAAGPTAPLEVAASGSWRGQALVLHGHVGSLLAAEDRDAPVPVQLALGVGHSAWRVVGTAGAGDSDVRVQGLVPDLRDLLPGAANLGTLTLGARFQAERGTSFRLSDLQLASAAGDLCGRLEVSLRGRPMVSGDLQSTRLDLDRLSEWRTEARPVQPTTRQPTPRPATPSGAGATPAMPWPLLRIADGDVVLRAGDLLAGGAHYDHFVAHAVLKAGRLLVDPLQADGPSGAVSARLEANAAASPPTLTLRMHPVMLPAAMLMRLLGAPDALRGAVELVGQLQASGESRSALAASLSGHAGLSMTGGAVANAALLELVGHGPALLAALPRTGQTDIRCLALHASFAGGAVAIDTAGLRTGRMSVDGHGRIGLADGGLDLRLLPDVSVGAAWASAPVRITGTLDDPHPTLDAAATGGRYALTIGSLGGSGSGAAAECGTPLRIAREDVPGPPPPPAASGRRKQPKAADILRGLGILR